MERKEKVADCAFARPGILEWLAGGEPLHFISYINSVTSQLLSSYRTPLAQFALADIAHRSRSRFNSDIDPSG